MKIFTRCNEFISDKPFALGMLIVKGDESLGILQEPVKEVCRNIISSEKFEGKSGDILAVPFAHENIHTIFLAGIGEKDDCAAIRSAVYKIVSMAAEKGIENIKILYDNFADASVARAAAEGAALAPYRFNKYISKKDDDKFTEPKCVLLHRADAQAANEGRILGEWQCRTRALANEPANIINPITLAEHAKELAQKMLLECEIWDEEKIQAERMGAYYAVARGSANKPRFIRVTYTPEAEARGHVVLVGKGLTFDSGGLDIKPSEFMLTMKGDKSGACAVLNAVCAAAEMKLPWKVTAIVAAAENMPGGNSFRPDDILTARNGKTIEINNTDAEGRLTLADALVFASELKPDYLIDIATLTGACAVALGGNTAGLFTNNDEFAEKFLAASHTTGERFWKMPMDDKYLRKEIKSKFADLSNCGSRYGGDIKAAMFLEEFVAADIPWIHLDIAALDFIEEPRECYSKGATGFGTRTLAEFIREL